MFRRLAIAIVATICLLSGSALSAQSITFAVDVVDPPTSHVGIKRTGKQIAMDINRNWDNWNMFSDWEQEILANSFADDENLYTIGEDVLFQMLLRAWCQHRPVVLTPDAIWMVIAQGFSHYVNENPEKVRRLLVNHEGKKKLTVETNNLVMDQADWEEAISRFTSEIDKYTNNDIATTLVADFSTTGINERIASEVTLMDVVKPYFDYEIVYAVCGIPSITLTGTPDDWRNVLKKTQALETFGLGWWVEDLEPILEEFIRASEGNPRIPFWKDIVKTTRPRTIKGPSCMKRRRLTKFDGWFIKLFPFDNEGRTPSQVTITQTVLPETVCVPVQFNITNLGGSIISSHDLEIVAGIVGVQEDPITYTLTPKIGWFVRTTKSQELIEKEEMEEAAYLDSIYLSENIDRFYSIELSKTRPWDKTPLTWDDFQAKYIGTDIYHLECYPSIVSSRKRYGNLLVDDWNYELDMIPIRSWCLPEFRNEGSLLLLQTGFNYAELSRRMAQTAMINGAYNIQPSDIKDDVESFIKKMTEETDAGRDMVSVRNWANSVEAELAQMEEPISQKPTIKPSGLGIGGHVIGVEKEYIKGDFLDYISPSLINASVGLDIFINRFDIMMNIQSRGGTINHDITHESVTWEKGEKITGGVIDISLGYTILDNNWLRLIPYAGIGVSYYDYRPQAWVDEDKKSDEIAGFRQIAGIRADIKVFRHYIKAHPLNFAQKDVMSEIVFRPRIYVAHASLPNISKVWSINFGLSLDFFFWETKRQYNYSLPYTY